MRKGEWEKQAVSDDSMTLTALPPALLLMPVGLHASAGELSRSLSYQLLSSAIA